MSVDGGGGLQKLDTSNRMSLAFFSANGIPENHAIATGTATRRSKELLEPWDWTRANGLKGPKKKKIEIRDP